MESVAMYIVLSVIVNFGIVQGDMNCPNQDDFKDIIIHWPIVRLNDSCFAAYSEDGCGEDQWVVPNYNHNISSGITLGSCQPRQCPKDTQDTSENRQFWALNNGTCVLIREKNSSICGNDQETVFLSKDGNIYCAEEPGIEGRGIFGSILGIPKKVVGSMRKGFYILRGYDPPPPPPKKNEG